MAKQLSKKSLINRICRRSPVTAQKGYKTCKDGLSAVPRHDLEWMERILRVSQPSGRRNQRGARRAPQITRK
jgi:hypothetical protein